MARRHFFAIGIFAALTLFCQVALTRLFSVVQYYHGAFLAISLALFGFAVSGVFVALWPGRFRLERLDAQLGRYGTLLAVSIPLSFFFYLYVGIAPLLSALGLPSALAVALEYLILAVPFFASGVCISLVLYHGATQANRLYATDLTSSALGAVLVVPCLAILGGPKSVLLASLIAAASTFPFRRFMGGVRFVAPAFGVLALTALLLAPQSAFNEFRLRKPPLVVASEPIFWNSFSMVGVSGDTASAGAPTKSIIIDNSVSTSMVAAKPASKQRDWTRRDWNAVAHRLRPGGEVLIIGAGGGRDILVALAHGQQPVWAVEVNPLVVRMANETYGDFTGHVYSRPGVRAVVGDARSFVANSSDDYDVILASLIDTWAASAAGAFALTENLLYTTDAFRDYFDHLSDDGILSISRWHPMETPRLLATGLTAWKEAGVRDPRRHAALMFTKPMPGFGRRIVVLLMKKSPFTDAEIQTLETFCGETGLICALTPRDVRDPLIARSLEAWQADGMQESWSGLDVAPVSDERPFFFNMVKPSTQTLRMLGLRRAKDPAGFKANLEATRMLVQLLGVVVVLLAATIGLPLLTRAGALRGRGWPTILGYFTCLGLGFILIEVGLVQRLILLLGKPVYALALILSTMLLASGAGSFASGRPATDRIIAGLPRLLFAVAALLAVLAIFLPGWIRSLLGTPFAVRVAASLLAVALPAFLMGMAFPSGVRVLGETGRQELVPWVWGVNGATSVLASVLAIILAIEFGYTVVFLLGAACYLGAALFFRGWAAPLHARG